ncbi:MAG: DUF2909 domain-containing protein [Porticoccaceae bacterium]|nr:DUF2909 domain-containing protein [Porticoccaceae bacterium]
MLLKIIIVVLFVAVLISLSSGLYFLIQDAGNSRRRLLHSLGVRVTLAALLLGAITYGFVSGKLGSTAPWDQQLHPHHTAPRP